MAQTLENKEIIVKHKIKHLPFFVFLSVMKKMIMFYLFSYFYTHPLNNNYATLRQFLVGNVPYDLSDIRATPCERLYCWRYTQR